jgi:hypothetical protein
MGWEERTGRRYYYRKRRQGGRVVSEYVGSGFLAELAAGMDETDRERKDLQRQAQQQLRAMSEELREQMAQLDDYTQTLTRAALLLAGFHPHKGQWRKRRNG